MTSSKKNGLNIRTNASPKWDRTRCPEDIGYICYDSNSHDFGIHACFCIE